MNDHDVIKDFLSGYGKVFQFEINSAVHIMDLMIKPPAARPKVCFQVHKMLDNANVLFWNFGLTARESMPLLRRYILENIEKFKDRWKTKLLDGVAIACRDEKFIEMLKPHASIYSHELSDDEMKLVYDVVNADYYLPDDCHGGLDGHSYKLKIYGEMTRELNFWCYVPKKWATFPPLVDFFVETAYLYPKRCYEVSGFAYW
ncbi:MAG: hypothetical protein IKZ58_07130 [Selenomonadaceae bacterium]|nr:hypothetical protein [Selenomonadaceae bacterium]